MVPSSSLPQPTSRPPARAAADIAPRHPPRPPPRAMVRDYPPAVRGARGTRRRALEPPSRPASRVAPDPPVPSSRDPARPPAPSSPAPGPGRVGGGVVGRAGRGRAGPRLRHRRPGRAHRASPPGGGRSHQPRCRAPGPRPAGLPGRRRGRRVPGVGDASLRAGEPQHRDDGAAAAHHVAPARPETHAPGAGGAGALARPAPRPPRGGRGARHRPARRPPRPGRPGGPPGRRRLPAGGAGRAPGTGGPAGVDRRRVPLHRSLLRRPPGAHRPVGRRGRPPHPLLRHRPAVHGRRRSRGAVPEPRAAALRRGPGPGRRADRGRAVGPGAVGAVGRGRCLRGDGVVAAVAHRRRAHPVRPARPRRPRPAGRAPPHA